MSKDDVKSLRSWHEIAKQVSEEDDPNRILELAEELIRALDSQSRKIMDEITPDEKVRKKGAA